MLPSVKSSLAKLTAGDCYELGKNATDAKSRLSASGCSGTLDRFMGCATISCKGESVNSVQLEPNQTFTLEKDSRCVYKVKAPTYMAANPNYQVIVSTTPMNNTMSALPKNYTLVTGPF